MKKELIKIDNYLLVVDDSEIQYDDYYVTWDNNYNPPKYEVYVMVSGVNGENPKKIIAHLPLGDSTIIEGVPLLPREILAKMQQKEALIELMNIDLVNGKETLEEAAEIKRSDLYKSIHSVVKQIPRMDVGSDAMDAPSCAYELEQLFYKWQQERMYSEIDLEVAFFEGRENSLTFIEWFEQFKKK